MEVDGRPEGRRPRALSLLAGLVWVEVVLLGLLALRTGWSLVAEEPLSVGGTVFLALLFAGCALWLAKAVSALSRGFRWPRSVVLVFQVFGLVVAGTFVQGGNFVVGVLLGLPLLLVALLLFSTPVVEATMRSTDSSRGRLS